MNLEDTPDQCWIILYGFPEKSIVCSNFIYQTF